MFDVDKWLDYLHGVISGLVGLSCLYICIIMFDGSRVNIPARSITVNPHGRQFLSTEIYGPYSPLTVSCWSGNIPGGCGDRVHLFFKADGDTEIRFVKPFEGVVAVVGRGGE